MLALALGMISGVAFSAAGWIVAAILLCFTLLFAGIAAAIPPLDMLFASLAVIFAFNAGLCVGMVPRVVLLHRESIS